MLTDGNSVSPTLLSTGRDPWGYNYQGHAFSGFYGNQFRPETPRWNIVQVSMKWNDAFLSNKSCDGDFRLDGSYTLDETYKVEVPAPSQGSGASLTILMSAVCYNGMHWSRAVRLEAAPEGATLEGGIWYDRSHRAIGASYGFGLSTPPVFAITSDIENAAACDMSLSPVDYIKAVNDAPLPYPIR